MWVGGLVLYCQWSHKICERMQAFPLFDAMPVEEGEQCAHIYVTAPATVIYVGRGRGWVWGVP